MLLRRFVLSLLVEMWRVLRTANPILDIRSRLEDVDQDGIARRAAAMTLRARAGFESGKTLGTTLLVEGELVAPLTDSYNDTTHGPRYGTETDLLLQAKRKRYRAALKYTDYGTAGYATDTNKLSAQLEYVW
jgi:hypothetical protein